MVTTRSPPPSPATRKRILLVDDEPEILEMLGALVRGGVPETETLLEESPFRALDVASGGHIDLVITDYRMPGLNGLELAKEVRRRKPDMPVILMTGFADDALRTEAFVARVNVLLKKPVDPPEFVGEIRRLLTKPGPPP